MVKTGPIRGDFPSLKLERMVRYGSTIERDLLYFLEYWASVTWYQEQPMTITWTLPDGQVRRYTPDYEIHKGPVKILAECKPEARLAGGHAQQQQAIGQSWAEENGYHFVTFTDIQMREGHQLENIKLFWRYARPRSSPDIQNSLLATMKPPNTSRSVIDLCDQLHLSPQDVVPVVCHLLFHHRLHMDLCQPFSTTTIIELERR
jgi:hypothetical protein